LAGDIARGRGADPLDAVCDYLIGDRGPNAGRSMLAVFERSVPQSVQDGRTGFVLAPFVIVAGVFVLLLIICGTGSFK
jgi:hypothetical protein